VVVFWQGYGFVGLLAGLLPVGTNFALSYPRPQSTALPVGLACLAAAAVCIVSWRMLRQRPGRHTLYGLPLWVWAMAYAGLAGWCLATAAGRA
jgi:Na+/melibiose symporter-like transporter